MVHRISSLLVLLCSPIMAHGQGQFLINRQEDYSSILWLRAILQALTFSTYYNEKFHRYELASRIEVFFILC